MKRFLVIILSLFIMSCATANNSSLTKYYDSHGNYAGCSVKTETSGTVYYDSHGQYKGYSHK